MADLTPTPHNAAKKGDIAKTVLMPGDPLRAKFVAENFLTDAVLFNEIRGMYGYTGKYKGVPVSVMGSGMGVPSICLYSHELYNFYDVDNIIRIGTAGGYQDDIHVGDICFAVGANTASNYAYHLELNGHYAPTCSFELLRKAVEAAEARGYAYHVGNCVTSDAFYEKHSNAQKWKDMGAMCVEMEAAGLYTNAAVAGKRALAILTISDHIFSGEEVPYEARVAFTKMMEVALDTAIAFTAE